MSRANSWGVFPHGWQDHVIPLDDLREHEIAQGCWCKPREEDDGVLFHNSLDGRESYENGRPVQ